MKKKINPNFRCLVTSYNNKKSGVLLKGGSRSGKTWASIYFLIWLCSKKENNAVINIVKETYNNFKTTLYNDFNQCLPMWGLSSPFQDVKEVASFNLLGNKINLLGADKPSKFLGAGSDYVWFNEMNHISKEIFDESEMRCSKMWWGDFNPDLDENHFINKNISNRPDVKIKHTTFLNNPFAPEQQKKKILSYDPSNPVNIMNGTADPYKWSVYGLGIMSKREGVIYDNWREYDDLPDCKLYKIFGMDFGFENDPTVLLELNINRKTMQCYVYEHIYETKLGTSEMIDKMKEIVGKHYCIIDNSHPHIRFDMIKAGIQAIKATKGKIEDDIQVVKKFNLIVHKTASNVQGELNKYVWEKDVNGRPLNKAIDKHNHGMDAIKYPLTWYNRMYVK
jgi:PBSX family phage terminase large subunit